MKKQKSINIEGIFATILNLHKACLDRGIIDQVCSHMDYKLTKWTDEMLYEEAKKYQYRNEFKRNSSAYGICITRGLIDKVCSHMGSVRGGFDKNKKATLYYIKFESEKFYSPIYKIGITNLKTKERISDMGVPTDVKYEIIHEYEFENGIDAFSHEKKILKQFREYKYNGKPFLANGNSELFNKDIFYLYEDLT